MAWFAGDEGLRQRAYSAHRLCRSGGRHSCGVRKRTLSTQIDRYIGGDEVAGEDFRQVWENTRQVSGVWSSPIYEEFFAEVRAFNQSVPVDKRIRVLLGDPPIDWEPVTSPADEDMNDWRDAHYAWMVEREVISKRRKALLFVGGAHISRRVMLPNSLIHLLDARFPGKTLVTSAIQVSTVSPRVAALIRSWPVPSAAEVRDSWLGSADVGDLGFGLSTGRVQEDIDVVLVLSKEAFSNVAARIDPSPPFAVELRRRQSLQNATLPFRGGKIRFDRGSISITGNQPLLLSPFLQKCSATVVSYTLPGKPEVCLARPSMEPPHKPDE